jgi:S-adenosylmethionine/arginine decarboxylase-like enzyme
MIQHKHLIVRAEVAAAPAESERDWLAQWFRQLIAALDMKLLSGPHIAYVDKPGNRGITAVAIIETSHIALHVWDEQSPALMQLDVYTCGALDVETVLERLDCFQPVKIETKFLDRETGLVELMTA